MIVHSEDVTEPSPPCHFLAKAIPVVNSQFTPDCIQMNWTMLTSKAPGYDNFPIDVIKNSFHLIVHLIC